MINILIVLTHFLFNNFGLAIIALTLIVNGLMLPLTLKQVRASKAMQEMQPKIAELKKKYGKDKEKMAREQMKLYKESGVSPAGCLLPMLIQMPIWIALYPVNHAGAGGNPGESGGAFPLSLFLAGGVFHAAPVQRFPLVEPGQRRHVPGAAGGRLDVGAAEDGDDPIARPQSEDPEQLDALDNAHYVCLVNPVVPQWAGSLLGDFEPV